MKLTVTGNEKEVDAGLTVAKLIELEQVETPEYVTVSVNDDFVPAGTFASHTLKDGDSVEFLYFMGGGQHDAASPPRIKQTGFCKLSARVENAQGTEVPHGFYE